MPAPVKARDAPGGGGRVVPLPPPGAPGEQEDGGELMGAVECSMARDRQRPAHLVHGGGAPRDANEELVCEDRRLRHQFSVVR